MLLPVQRESVPCAVRDVEAGHEDTHVPGAFFAEVETELKTSVVDGDGEEVTSHCTGLVL